MSTNKNRRRRNPKGDSKGSSSKGTYGRNTVKYSDDHTEAVHNNTFISGLSEKQINDVGSIPWGYPAGRPQELLTSQHVSNSGVGKLIVPGIMAIDLIFGPGRSWDYWSPVNQAALNQMTFLRANNSRSDSKYQASDLIIYEMAMESAFILYQVIKRAYYSINTWNSENRYTPDMLVRSMGFDYKDLKKNLPRLRSYMDQFMTMVGSLPLPGNLEIFKRHLSYFSNVYEDAESQKAQYYLFRPNGLYIYDEWRRDLPIQETIRPGRARFVKWEDLIKTKFMAASGDTPYGWDLDPSTDPMPLLTVDGIIEILEFIGTTLMSSDDVMAMGADIKKAYGDENVWYLDSIDPNYTIDIVHSPDVLLEIHNSRFFGNVLYNDYLSVEQTATGLAGGDALIHWSPMINRTFRSEAERDAHNPQILLDQWKDQPSPSEVVTMTRLTTSIHPDSLALENPFLSVGTIFPVKATMFTINPSGTLSETSFSTFNTGAGNLYHSTISKFDWHPFVYLATYDNDTTRDNIASYAVIGDLDSWTVIDKDLLRRQHEVDTIAQWRIPETSYYK